MKRETRFKLAAFDMDGTTLNSNHEMTSNTIEAINKFSERGVTIIFATGRMDNAVKEHLNRINTEGLVITHNGGLIKNLKSGEVLSRKVVPSNIVEEIISFSKVSETVLHINTDNEVLISKNHSFSEKYAEELKITLTMSSFEQVENVDPISLLLIDEKEKLREYLDLMIQGFKNQFDYVFIPWTENTWMLQFLAPNTSKGHAVIELSKLLGIDPKKEVISFGDSYNDLEMISGTYFGVAMSNACKELKDVAKYVTKSNDLDGVAYVLDKLEMNEQRFLCDL